MTAPMDESRSARGSGVSAAPPAPDHQPEHRRRLAAFVRRMQETGTAVEEGRNLADLARWRIGGPADALVSVETTAQVAAAVAAARDLGLPLFVLGSGSNMLFSSAGFRGVVLRLAGGAARPQITGAGGVVSTAAAQVPCLARRLAQAGLGGLEHMVGIPGTLGGLVVMNGGSQRKGIGTHVRAVTVVDRDAAIRRIAHADLGFAYRTSVLQSTGAIVTEVELGLAPRAPSAVRQEMVAILAARRKKFPKNLPNCGSTFLSNPAMYETVGPPGQIIERLGLKGLSLGGAQVSPLHANFIVNRGGATSDEVLALIAHIRATVLRQTGFAMDCEVRYLSECGEERPVHEFTDSGRFDSALLGGLKDANG